MVVAVDEKADQRGAHPAVFAAGFLLLADGVIRLIDVATNRLRIEMRIAIKRLQQAATGYRCRDIPAGKSGYTVADHKAGRALTDDITDLITVTGAIALIRRRGNSDIHASSVWVCESLY